MECEVKGICPKCNEPVHSDESYVGVFSAPGDQNEGHQIYYHIDCYLIKEKMMKCPTCGGIMTLGTSYADYGTAQWECHNCGHCETVN